MPPTTPDIPQAGRIPRKVVIGIIVGWFLIAIKCMLAPWAMAYWHVPVDPGWVIVPTLLMAGLATVLVYTHAWTPDET